MRRLPTFLAIALTSIAGCSDHSAVAPAATPDPFKGVVISEARPQSPVGNINSRTSLQFGDQDFAYVSIAPNTLAASTKVEISNRTKNLPASVFSLTDGGLDPVAIQADAGDTLELNVWHNDGSQQPILVKVPTKRPPAIVRTSPPRGRTDVALNVVITVIFTEPVDPKTVSTSSLQLFRNGELVTGKAVLEDNQWTADFIPDAPLLEGSTYELVVDRTVHDLDGDVLDSTFTSTFSTGECDPAFDSPACANSTRGTVVTGSVIDRTGSGSKSVSGAIVDAWSQLPDGSGARLGAVRSDATGSYAVTVPVGAKVQLRAFIPAFDQPCGVSVDASAKAPRADIEVVAVTGPQPTAAISHPRITGYVQELVPDPARDNQLLLVVPVARARLFLEAPKGFLAASTTTDNRGFFTLCRVPLFEDLALSAVMPGYPQSRRALSLSGLQDVDGSVWLYH